MFLLWCDPYVRPVIWSSPGAGEDQQGNGRRKKKRRQTEGMYEPREPLLGVQLYRWLHIKLIEPSLPR